MCVTEKNIIVLVDCITLNISSTDGNSVQFSVSIQRTCTSFVNCVNNYHKLAPFSFFADF